MVNKKSKNLLSVMQTIKSVPFSAKFKDMLSINLVQLLLQKSISMKQNYIKL